MELAEAILTVLKIAANKDKKKGNAHEVETIL